MHMYSLIWISLAATLFSINTNTQHKNNNNSVLLVLLLLSGAKKNSIKEIDCNLFSYFIGIQLFQFRILCSNTRTDVTATRDRAYVWAHVHSAVHSISLSLFFTISFHFFLVYRYNFCSIEGLTFFVIVVRFSHLNHWLSLFWLQKEHTSHATHHEYWFKTPNTIFSLIVSDECHKNIIVFNTNLFSIDDIFVDQWFY